MTTIGSPPTLPVHSLNTVCNSKTRPGQGTQQRRVRRTAVRNRKTPSTCKKFADHAVVIQARPSHSGNRVSAYSRSGPARQPVPPCGRVDNRTPQPLNDTLFESLSRERTETIMENTIIGVDLAKDVIQLCADRYNQPLL